MLSGKEQDTTKNLFSEDRIEGAPLAPHHPGGAGWMQLPGAAPGAAVAASSEPASSGLYPVIWAANESEMQ